MIISVVPIKRFPRGIDFFDYRVPPELQDTIKIGQLVEIPLRKSTIYGLVLSTKKEDSESLKELISIVFESPLVNKEHLKFLYTLSKMYGTSMGTLAKMSLLPLQKRKLKKIELTYSNEPRELILVPEVHLVDEVRQKLSIEDQKKTVVWHSKLTPKQQFERWLQVHSGERPIIIGTRGACLLPIPNLKKIIVEYEHSDNHKNWDQAPRFHVKDAVKILKSLYNAEIEYKSFSQSVGQYTKTKTVQGQQYSQKIKIVSLSEERKAGRYGAITDEVKEVILNSEEDVFIYINRLGFSRTVMCKECGYVNKCDRCELPLVYHQKLGLVCHYCRIRKKLSSTCPKCDSQMIEMRGIGTEFVENGVRDLIGENSAHDVIRIDSEIGGDLPYSKKPRVLVGTQMALRHVRWKKTESIILLEVDQLLSIPEYKTRERVWHLLQEIIYRKKSDADFFVQTYETDHLLFKSLTDKKKFYEQEVKDRQELLYPPHSYIVRYFYGHRDDWEAKNEVNRVRNIIENELTKTKKSAKISQAIELYPKFYRNKNWYGIVIRLPKKVWQKDLIWLNSLIPSGWKIDPNPTSLLSP